MTKPVEACVKLPRATGRTITLSTRGVTDPEPFRVGDVFHFSLSGRDLPERYRVIAVHDDDRVSFERIT